MLRKEFVSRRYWKNLVLKLYNYDETLTLHITADIVAILYVATHLGYIVWTLYQQQLYYYIYNN